jgi:hypothetical protein
MTDTENEQLLSAVVHMAVADIVEQAGAAGATVAEIAAGLYAVGDDERLQWPMERIELVVGMQIQAGFLVQAGSSAIPPRWCIAERFADGWRDRAQAGVYAVAAGQPLIGLTWLTGEQDDLPELSHRVLAVVACSSRPLSVQEVILLAGEAGEPLSLRAIRQALAEHQRGGAIMHQGGGWTATPAFVNLLAAQAIAAARG